MLHTSELQLSAPQEEQARFCLHFPETLQPINSDLEKLLEGPLCHLPKAADALSLGVGGQPGVGVSPHLAGSGPPDLGKAFLLPGLPGASWPQVQMWCCRVLRRAGSA